MSKSNRALLTVVTALAVLVAVLASTPLLGSRSDPPAAPATAAAPDPSAAAGERPASPRVEDASPGPQRNARLDRPARSGARRLHGRVLCATTRRPVVARIGTGRAAVFSSADDGVFDGVLDLGDATTLSVSAAGFESRGLEIGDDTWLEVLLQPVRGGRVLVLRQDGSPVAAAEVWTIAGGARVSLGTTDERGERTIPTGRMVPVWAESDGAVSAMARMAPGDETTLVLAGGAGGLGVRDPGGSPEAGLRLRVQPLGETLLGAGNIEDLVTGADGLAPPLPFGAYEVDSETHHLALDRPASHATTRRTLSIRLEPDAPTVWLEAVPFPSLAVRVVDEGRRPWTSAVLAWLERSDGGRRTSARGFEPDASGLVTWSDSWLDRVEADAHLCVSAPGTDVARVLVAAVARGRPPQEVVLRDAPRLVRVDVVAADGDPVDFPLRLFDISGMGRIEVFAGVPPRDGIRFAWRGGDLLVSEMFGVGRATWHISWPLGRLAAGRVSLTRPNELRLERAGTLVVEAPETFRGPLFCARRPGSTSRTGRREGGAIVFDRLPPGDYAVGSRGWVESASLRWAHERLGPVSNSARVDSGSTTRVRWDPAWVTVDVTGTVRTTGVDPGELVVHPVYADPLFPVSLGSHSRFAAVRADGTFRLRGLEGSPEYLVVSRIDVSGAVVPYTVCEPGASAHLAAGDVEVQVAGEAAEERRVVCAYEPRLPGGGGRILQRVDLVEREGRSGERIELRGVPTYVDEIQVRIGERRKTVSVRVRPGQRTQLAVEW